jgi:hypothetical protein
VSVNASWMGSTASHDLASVRDPAQRLQASLRENDQLTQAVEADSVIAVSILTGIGPTSDKAGLAGEEPLRWADFDGDVGYHLDEFQISE